ncbi:MAG: hypothetical protein ABWY09_09870 [Stenotrophomonas maltophilia]
MKQAAAGAVMLLLLVGCQSDPQLRSKRIGPGHYRLTVDRCHVISREQLERDLRELASTQCSGSAGVLEAMESLPSRQGGLLGECLRSGALRAEVRCR